MRALVLTDFGAVPRIRDIVVPEPAAGEVRVRVRAASVNGFDFAVANGYLAGVLEHRFPVVLGKDFAGVVDKVGADVTDYARGDRVFGVVTKPWLGDGSFAELVTVPVWEGIAKLPDDIDYTEGSALGLAGTAAYDSITAALLRPGQSVLVAGATGGVGNQAVQLAARAGARVIATAHDDRARKLVLSLGALELVDPMENVADQLRVTHPDGVDVILHFAGDPVALLAALRPDGRLVSTIVSASDQLPGATATIVPIYANPTPETLRQLAENQRTGRTRVVLHHVYGLDEAPAALRDFAEGTLGKLIIVIE